MPTFSERLAAVIEGAMRAAPHATIPDLAAHCARVYAMAIEQGLITADGTGPHRRARACGHHPAIFRSLPLDP